LIETQNGCHGLFMVQVTNVSVYYYADCKIGSIVFVLHENVLGKFFMKNGKSLPITG
jgi:hypothetical protein